MSEQKNKYKFDENNTEILTSILQHVVEINVKISSYDTRITELEQEMKTVKSQMKNTSSKKSLLNLFFK